MRNKLYLGVIALAFLSLGTAMAISINAGSGGPLGNTWFTGDYIFDDTTTSSNIITLNSGTITKETKVQGPGINSLDESISTADNSVRNTVFSSGSMSVSSSSMGSKNGVLVNHAANLAGDVGFIGTTAVSPTNKMIVASVFEDAGSLTERSNSASGNAAYVGGTISSAGVDLLNGEIAQAVYSGAMKMEVEGLSMSVNDKIGKFGIVAVNQAKGGIPTAPTGTAAVASTITTTSDPTLPGEVMTNLAYLGSSSSYKLLNYKIGSPVKLYLKDDKNLVGEGLDSLTTSASIATAAETWDRSTKKELFVDNVIVSSSVQADKGDGYSVHAFIPISGNAIAYARTWTSRGLVADSDVCYNTNGITQADGSTTDIIWKTTWDNNWVSSGKNLKGIYPASYTIDVQSIALHELGHTLGLGDLYLSGSTDWYQAMNSYNGPQRYLGKGDITGLQRKYGK